MTQCPTTEHIRNLEKTITIKDPCTPMFIAALFTIARTWKQPRCPSTDEQIQKLCRHNSVQTQYIQWTVTQLYK